MNFLDKIRSWSLKTKNFNTSPNEMLDNLIYFSKLINEYEHFVFFGTLLGLIRENNIIEGDDDIDFYINIKHRSDLIKKLKANSIKVDQKISFNTTDSFLQVYREYNNKIFFVDFYFYDSELDKDFIIEKWNFIGSPHINKNHLRVPKIFIFPIQCKQYKSTIINFPSQPIYICEYLYGPNWNKKIKKDKDYEMKIINNKPVLLEKNNIEKNIYFKKIFGKFYIRLKKKID